MKALKWTASLAGMMGATAIALNMPWSGYGFVAFLASSCGWLAAAIAERQGALAALNVVYTVINVIGIVRWLV